jgi:parallel beta-helix repeat protein
MRALIISLLFVAGPLLSLLIAGTHGARATEVSGDIYSTAVWSSTMSPVYITGNVTVHDSGSLVILAGTEVRFDEGTHLNIEGGALSVQGTMNSPVSFLPNSSIPYSGYYEWIYANNSPYYHASVTAQWADLTFGVKGFYLDGIQGARFDHVRVSSTSEAGIYLNACTGTGLWNCSFSDSGSYGIWLDGSDNTTVGDCVISVPAGTGVFLQSSLYNSVQSSTARGSLWGMRTTGSEHNLFTRCDLSDDMVGLELESSPNNTVFDCTFAADGTGLLINGSRDCLFRGNNFTGCQLPLSFDGGPDAAANGFDPDNLVGGLPVRYVVEGDLDGVSAGAVILAGAKKTTVSNITFPAAGGIVVAYLCDGVTLRDFRLPGPYYGILAAGCIRISLENVTVSGAQVVGLMAAHTGSLDILNCTFEGCDRALVLDGPLNATLSGTDVTGNRVGLDLTANTIARCVDCTFQNSTLDDSSLLYEDYTLRILVRDNSSGPLSGVDANVQNAGQTLYASAHFGGAYPRSDAAGELPPVQVTGAVYRGVGKTPYGTLVEVWDGTHIFEGNPRNLSVSAPTRAVFSVTDTGLLAGMVRDPAGDPVDNVNIVLDSGANTSTGADGLYEFPPLPPGTYAINASLAGWQTVNRQSITVSVGQTTYINLTLDADSGFSGEVRGYVFGTVMDQAPTALLGAFISITGGKTTTTDATGLFRIPAAPAGWVNITVSKAGYYDAAARAYVPPNGSSRWANVTLPAVSGAGNGSVAGQVWDAVTLTLMGGVTVWVEDIPSISNVTDAYGNFVLLQVPAGNHTILASKSGFANGSTAAEVIAGKTSYVNFYMAGPTGGLGGLVGKVYDIAKKTYLGGATVRIDGTFRIAGTDPVGDYRFENLTAGTYSVTATAPLMGWTNEQGVVVRNGQWTTLDIGVGTDVTVANNTLGVSVSGDITGNGTLVIRAAPTPPVLPPGGNAVFFEISAHEINFTKLISHASPDLMKSVINGSDLKKIDIHFWTHHGDEWEAGDTWEIINDSSYDPVTGYLHANITRLSQFSVSVTAHRGPTSGGTIVALPPWLTPVAVVAIVLLVGVPIGIIVIRVRQPPTRGGQMPGPPRNQSGTNLYP